MGKAPCWASPQPTLAWASPPHTEAACTGSTVNVNLSLQSVYRGAGAAPGTF